MQLYTYYSGFVTCSDGSTRGSTPRMNMKKDDILELHCKNGIVNVTTKQSDVHYFFKSLHGSENQT